MLLELKEEIIYGPVNSRRLGRSLGINLFPLRQKYCSFNCCYCHYGWTDYDAMDRLPSGSFPDVPAVMAAVEAALVRLAPHPPDYLTFSGNGEPTLHPRFPDMAAALRDLRDRRAPDSRTAVLSNSSRVMEPAIRRGLDLLDLRIMKLDAGTPVMLRRFNDPEPGIRLVDMVAGLAAMGRVTLQALFAGGPAGNLAPEHVATWRDCLARIRPQTVQIYTLDRGYPGAGIRPATTLELEEICDRLTEAEIPAQVFCRV
ncbi:MAG: radical SAM protein [Acidobacteria bacterium]|nr:radical SAM protein [Acidobacteriota bacterium]